MTIPEELNRILGSAAAEPIEHDPEWPSPAELLPPDESGFVRWRPVAVVDSSCLNIVSLRADLREFFGSYWGKGASGRHSGEVAILRIAWNEQELAEIATSSAQDLAEGHPVCVAYTDSDWFFGVDNASGEVWLCEPGYPPIRQVAESLNEFLAGFVKRDGA